MFRTAAIVTFALATLLSSQALAGENPSEPLTMIVMDPLAAPLSCPCVEGYAQRKYEKLAAVLEKKLGRPVKVHFSESLSDALKKKSNGKADLIIGKHSVVQKQAKAIALPVAHVAALTGKDGKTTQTGLVVVASRDPALTVFDLKGYQVILGTADCDEKHIAALNLFKDCAVVVPPKPKTCTACSEGAVKVLELREQGQKAVTVISSYAAPLLEGCGTIKKGDLRVIGVTEEVPFVAAFVNTGLGAQDRAIVTQTLLEVGKDPALCKALETRLGFVKAEKKN